MQTENIQTPETQEPLPHIQADDATGRQSGGNSSPSDDLLHTDTTAEKNYETWALPEELKEQEENFTSFKKLAQELELPLEKAEKLMQWQLKQTQNSRQIADAAREQILQTWRSQTQEMLGPAYGREIARALAAVDRFGGEELRLLLQATGLADHPVIVKTFQQIGKQISEDVSVGGSVQKTQDKTFAEALYGNAQ